jgi:transcriptional regulator with XRE-family HTH domain
MEQNLWSISEGERSVGQLLALERQRQGVSQGDLARRLGVSQANLSRIERGADLRFSTLLDVVRALGMEPMIVPKNAVGVLRSVLESMTRKDGEEKPDTPRFA